MLLMQYGRRCVNSPLISERAPATIRLGQTVSEIYAFLSLCNKPIKGDVFSLNAKCMKKLGKRGKQKFRKKKTPGFTTE